MRSPSSLAGINELLVVAGVVLIEMIKGSCICHAQAEPPVCPHCGWSPPATTLAVKVKTVDELESAVATAASGTTILIQDGTYRLSRSLDFSRPGIVLRSLSGDRSKVILRGQGMQERRVGVAVSISAPNIIVADLTLSQVGFHGVQVRGENGVSGVVVHNLLVKDTGQQLLKGSISDNGKYSRDVLVACSSFEYSNQAPSDYTNGVDVLGGRDWVVRDNRFRNIRGPQAQGYKAGPTILFWRDTRDVRILRNVVIDCYRGIALGLVTTPAQPRKESGPYYDNQRGLVCNNVVCNLNGWCDEAIEVNATNDARIEHNTVLTTGKNISWSIGVRFPNTRATVRNNLTNKSIIERDGARIVATGNVTAANQSWFMNAAAGDFRFASPMCKAIDAGVDIPPREALDELATDFLQQRRAYGVRPDAGAYEYWPVLTK